MQILILQIAIIVGVSHCVGFLFQRIRQPKVIGEMFAGIILGPSMLGWAAPHISALLFPMESLGYLNALSQVGIVIYMFLVGLSLNPKDLREHGRSAILTSLGSIVVPFGFGALLAFYLYPGISYDTVSVTDFALFIGAALSVTAFPVLARILTDLKMLGTPLGTLAITCAAVDDVAGWCILAYIVFINRAHLHSYTSVPLWVTLAGLGIFLVSMLWGIKHLLRGLERIYKRDGQLSDNVLALMILIVLISSLVTEKLGLHLLFGSFLAGVIMPKDPGFVREVLKKFESIAMVLLLPLFFAFTGLRTSIQLIHGVEMWFICLAIIIVAIIGKVSGTMFAARAAGINWREAAGIGILMNTRGLMELIILNIGFDIGVISPPVFSMLVLMALVTTFMTVPLLDLIYPKRLLQESSTDLGALSSKSA